MIVLISTQILSPLCLFIDLLFNKLLFKYTHFFLIVCVSIFYSIIGMFGELLNKDYNMKLLPQKSINQAPLEYLAGFVAFAVLHFIVTFFTNWRYNRGQSSVDHYFKFHRGDSVIIHNRA